MIADYLIKRRPGSSDLPLDLKLLYVQLLAKFQLPGTASTLAQVYMSDSESQVTSAALDALTIFGRQWAIPYLVPYLSNPNNALVNRAASALDQLQAREAILPLINALITTHVDEGGADRMNVGTGDGTFSIGKKPPVSRLLENPSVRAALLSMTNQNFGYNREQWLAWYASTYAPPADDLRRDP